MSNQSEEELKKAYSFLNKGDPASAKTILAEAYQFNLDNNEIDFAIWCCSFWIDYIKKLPKLELLQQGEGLFFQWKTFEEALTRKKEIFNRTIFSVQTGVFTQALQSLTNLYQELEKEKFSETRLKADINLKISICHKKLGNYETALEFLQQANTQAPGSADIFAEMADCYALCGLEKQAKVLFREAFFINARRIELTMLDSELIKCLINQVQSLGYSGQELQEWVPVYGTLYGVFSVKRELRSQEVGRLKQEIFELDVENRNPGSNSKLNVPKLINKYFWLLDHLIQKNEGDSKINEILLKIKLLDQSVYDLYNK